jgi:hypothetical protein
LTTYRFLHIMYKFVSIEDEKRKIKQTRQPNILH